MLPGRRMRRSVTKTFEPVVNTFSQLETAAGKSPGVRCHNLALWNTTPTMEIVMTWRTVEASALLAELPDARRQTVEVTMADALCGGYNVAMIDLLEFNTEGDKMAVLDGAAGLLGRGAIGAVYDEVCFSADNRHNTLFAEVLDGQRDAVPGIVRTRVVSEAAN